MQSLQANAQDLRSAGLIVIGRFQGLQDEQALRLTHRGADAEAHRVGLLHGRARSHLAESRGQVSGFNQRSVAHDDGPLQGIAQLANIAWPGMRLEGVRHRIADAGNCAAVFFVHVGQQ